MKRLALTALASALGVGLLFASPDTVAARRKAPPSGAYKKVSKLVPLVVSNAGHPGVAEPHYHVILWYVSPQRAAQLAK